LWNFFYELALSVCVLGFVFVWFVRVVVFDLGVLGDLDRVGRSLSM